MNEYRNNFTCWADIIREFGEGHPGLMWGTAVKQIRGVPPVEPEEVLWADYEYEDYLGNALIIYRSGNMVYEVTGGHCSCYGLEGQWQPEEYDIPTYIAALERRPQREGEKIALAKLKLMIHG